MDLIIRQVNIEDGLPLVDEVIKNGRIEGIQENLPKGEGGD